MTRIGTNPLISICIPAYNAETYIRACLESALAQTYRPVEIVVVDDGSEDATADIVAEYSEVVLLRSNRAGAQVSRNKALRASRGEYVQFLDADDLLAPAKLESQISCLLRNEADLVFCNKQELFPDGTLRPRPSPPSPDGVDGFIYCLRYNMLGAGTSIDSEAPLHRRSFLERVGGFREGVRRGQDKDLALRLCAAGARLKLIDEVLATYRQYEGPRISNRERPAGYVVDYLVDLADLLERDPAYDLSDERRHALADVILRKSKRAYRNGARAEATAGFARALSLDPRCSDGESVAYAALRRVVGYGGTERLRALILRDR